MTISNSSSAPLQRSDEAHRLLRQMAMDQGKKLSEVAKTIIDMADVWR